MKRLFTRNAYNLISKLTPKFSTPLCSFLFTSSLVHSPLSLSFSHIFFLSSVTHATYSFTLTHRVRLKRTISKRVINASFSRSLSLPILSLPPPSPHLSPFLPLSFLSLFFTHSSRRNLRRGAPAPAETRSFTRRRRHPVSTHKGGGCRLFIHPHHREKRRGDYDDDISDRFSYGEARDYDIIGVSRARK